METKKFPLGDVLSVTTTLLVSPRGMDGLVDILHYMTGNRPFTTQLTRFINECRPFLLQQFPQLDSPEAQFAVGELIEMLKTPSGKEQPDRLIIGWISKLTSGQYGVKFDEMLEVETIPAEAHEKKNPLEEYLEAQSGAKPITHIFLGLE